MSKKTIITLSIILILSLLAWNQSILANTANRELTATIEKRMSDVESSLKSIIYDLTGVIQDKKLDNYYKRQLVGNLDTVTFTTQDLCNMYYGLSKLVGDDLDINNDTATITHAIRIRLDNRGSKKTLTESNILLLKVYKKVFINMLECFKRVHKQKQYKGLRKVYIIMEGLSIYSRGIEWEYFGWPI